MKMRCWLSVFMALVFLFGLTPAGLAASSAAKVSSFDELRLALEGARNARVELTDDIETDDDLYLKDISSIALDGNGHTLTANHGIIVESARRGSLELSEIVIASDRDGPFIDVLDGQAGVDVSMDQVSYSGGAFISAGKLTCMGDTKLYDSRAADGAAMLDVGGSLRLADHSLTEVRVAAKTPDTKTGYPSEEDGIIALREGADIVLEKIDGFSIVYEGFDLCTHVCDDEEEECEHVCADENYACSLNILISFLGDNRVRAAADYPGRYAVELVYADGETDAFDKLSGITADRLRGVTEMHIRYIAPESVDISGKLVWNDEKNEYDTRPDGVTVVLYANGEKTGDTLKLKSGSFTFEDMPYSDGDGTPIVYTVRLKGDLKPTYKTRYDDNSRTITNSLVRHTFEGEHVWENDEGLEGGRAKTLKVQYRRSDGETGSFTIKTDKKSKKFSVESKLNQYDADGGKFSYTFSIAEKDRVPGYEHTISLDKKGKIHIASKLSAFTVTYYNLFYAEGVQTAGNGTPDGVTPGSPVRVDTIRIGESYAYWPPTVATDENLVNYALFMIEADNPELQIDMGSLSDPSTEDPPSVKADSLTMNSVVYLKYSEEMYAEVLN